MSATPAGSSIMVGGVDDEALEEEEEEEEEDADAEDSANEW